MIIPGLPDEIALQIFQKAVRDKENTYRGLAAVSRTWKTLSFANIESLTITAADRLVSGNEELFVKLEELKITGMGVWSHSKVWKGDISMFRSLKKVYIRRAVVEFKNCKRKTSNIEKLIAEEIELIDTRGVDFPKLRTLMVSLKNGKADLSNIGNLKVFTLQQHGMSRIVYPKGVNTALTTHNGHVYV